MLRVLSLIICCVLSVNLSYAGTKAPSTHNTSAAAPTPDYPVAAADQIRYKITLPAQANEQNYQVELLFDDGEQESCNQIRRYSRLDVFTLAGWGYDYYQLAQPAEPLQTRMACIDPPKKQRIDIIVPDNLVTYNSKLPIVIYVPKEVNVSYRIWEVQKESHPATPF